MGRMASDRPIWFVGDRADPTAAAIARRLPGDRTRLIAAPGQLPRLRLTPELARPAVIIVHRSLLSRGDLDRLARLRAWLGEAGRIVLCVGPHVRASEVERWLAVVDVAIPDVVAATTIGRHVPAAKRVSGAPLVAADGSPVRVAVVSTNPELRATLAALLRAHRFAVTERAEVLGAAASAGGSGPIVTVWEIPALEPNWPDRLRWASTTGLGPLVVLIGFLDTRDARAALDAGAHAALDLPVDAVDLVEAVRHAAQTRRHPPHPTPPAPNRSTRGRVRVDEGRTGD